MNNLCLLALANLAVLMGVLWGQELPGWSLVWSDEFDQADGSLPDASKWGYDLGRGQNGWGNAELQYYTNRSENARIENGELVIEVRRENNFARSGANFTSARLLTKNKWDWRYGRFEARVQVPSGSGMWPAFWMLGSDIDTVGWPTCGEIDVMEYVGRRPLEIFGTIHGPGYAGGASFGAVQRLSRPIADDYHVFAVEWEEGEIRWYCDGALYHSARPENVAPNQWVFDHEFFLLLNVAVGGNFGGALDPALTFPREMRVDYVRVYQPASTKNRLENPGFETGQLGPWIPYDAVGANNLGAFVEPKTARYYNGGNGSGDFVLTRSGDYVAKVFGDFTGGLNFNGFYQDVAATPGSKWRAGGFALTHPQDLMVGSNQVWLEVTFRDEADEVLGLYRSEILTSATVAPGEWMDLGVNQEGDVITFAELGMREELTAPAGTTTARFQSVFRQEPGFDGGAMYFDDLFLEPVEEALEAKMELGILLTWEAGTEENFYQVQQSEDGLGWENLGEAGRSMGSFFVVQPAAFLRVLEMAEPGGAGGGTEVAATREAGFRVSWMAVAGQEYRLTSSEDLEDFSTVEASVTGQGTRFEFSQALGEFRRFFRVEAINEP